MITLMHDRFEYGDAFVVILSRVGFKPTHLIIYYQLTTAHTSCNGISLGLLVVDCYLTVILPTRVCVTVD